MGRNTMLLQEIVTVIDQPSALDRLGAHFRSRLIVDAGNTDAVATLASQLRLSITSEECARVLEHLAEVSLTIDQVETAVCDLFGNRFIEPS